MNTITSRIFISAATVLWAATVQGAALKTTQDCVVEEIKIPGFEDVRPVSISKSGDIAGTVYRFGVAQMGFFQRSGETTFLPPSTYVRGANGAGTLVGGGRDGAFKWVNGNFTLLPDGDPSPPYAAYAIDINAHGLIVGSCTLYRACYWEGDHLEARLLEGFYTTKAYAVNNAGVIVGSGANPGADQRCVKWEAGNPTILPSGESSSCYASAINNRGEIAGTILAGLGTRAVIWRGNVMSYLGSEREIGSAVKAISANGLVVGLEFLDGVSPVAVYWRGGKKHLFNDLQCVKRSGWNLSTADSISSAGIVGEGVKPDGTYGAYLLRGAFNE